MNPFSKKIFLILLCIICMSHIFSQDEDETLITNQVWLDYHMYFKFKPRWEYYGDIGYRVIPKNWAWHTFLIRPSVRYIAPKLWEASGGIGLFQTFIKDEQNSFEVRPWQGVKIKWPSFNMVNISHYVRLEERIFFPEGDPMEFNFRARYLFGARIIAYRLENENQIFIPAYVEFFWNFGPKITEVVSNRTRLSVGVGYKTWKGWTFEFCFVGQYGRSGTDEQFKTAERLYQFKVSRHLAKRQYKDVPLPDEL